MQYHDDEGETDLLSYHWKSPGSITHSSLILAKLIMKCLPLRHTHKQPQAAGSSVALLSDLQRSFDNLLLEPNSRKEKETTMNFRITFPFLSRKQQAAYLFCRCPFFFQELQGDTLG